MGKGAFIGVDGVARKIKGGYIGIDGVARKIKSAYIGVGGVARPCWSGGGIEYFGQITPLSNSVHHVGAASIGNYALFAGGEKQDYGNEVSTVDTYNSNLTKGSATSLNNELVGVCGGSTNSYAIFAGGGKYNSRNEYLRGYSYVSAYNSSLVKTSATNLNYAKYYIKRASFGDNILFAGGYYETGSTSKARTEVESYNDSLVHSMLTNVDHTNVYCGCGDSVGDFALFQGYDTISVYTRNLTKTNSIDLSASPVNFAASACTKDYMLIAGGQLYNLYSTNNVHTINKNLVKGTATSLVEIKDRFVGVSSDNYAIFAGGRYWDSSSNLKILKTVDTFNNDLVKDISNDLQVAKQQLSAALVGNYAIFAGGNTTTSDGGVSMTGTSTVDAYTIA